MQNGAVIQSTGVAASHGPHAKEVAVAKQDSASTTNLCKADALTGAVHQARGFLCVYMEAM